MKLIKNNIFFGAIALLIGAFFTSCDLNLAPIDYYGSESYWKKEAHIVGYMDGMHNHLRSTNFQRQFVLGEARGGSLVTGKTSQDFATQYNNIKLQNLSQASPGLNNWGGYYGRIFNTNFFIQKTLEAGYMPDDKKAFYLGQAYGLRALYYFDLYRTYGGVPLQLEPKVTDGILDPEELYAERSAPSLVMKQIKADIEESLKYFGNTTSFDPYNRGYRKSYWSKAATETLKGEVYLWTSKVTTGDDAANEADLAVAKTAFTNVLNNYGLELLDDYSKVFDARTKGHAEAIMAVRYAEGEASNNAGSFAYSLLGGFLGTWAGRDGKVINKDTLEIQAGSGHWNEYKFELFTSFDPEDTRRDATFLDLYNPETKKLAGLVLRKNLGYNNAQGVRQYVGDEFIYRLPFVYLSLAEIENMQGGDVAKYINPVRKRAYGANWNEAVHGYKNGNFTQNELAILAEKDKEFINEGQRWYDVRRMTLTKGGKHLVFVKEGNIGSDRPLLDEATEAYKVLWPIETNMMNKDPKVKQTPGYEE